MSDIESASPSRPFGTCKVCQAPATGHHYGAVSCEACKGFFKRAESTVNVRGQEKTARQFFQCHEGGSCLMTGKERARCRKCRYEKCIEAGMSLDHIRLGRRWNRDAMYFATKPYAISRLVHFDSLPDVPIDFPPQDFQGFPRCRSVEEQRTSRESPSSTRVATPVAGRHMSGGTFEPVDRDSLTVPVRPPIDLPRKSSVIRGSSNSDVDFVVDRNVESGLLGTNTVSVIVFGHRNLQA